MTTIYLGIDPGKQGALGYITEGGRLIRVIDMPATPRDLWEELCAPRATVHDLVVVVEQQPAMPSQSSSTTAVQQRGFGRIEGVLACTGLRYELVSASAWKRAMGLTAPKSEGEKKTPGQRTKEAKQRALEMARRLWPDAPLGRVKDDGRAESLLLAEWLRRREIANG